MKFIKSSKHKSLINLEKATYIFVVEEKRKIYFTFDSMNADDMNEIQWEFTKDEKGFIDAINEIESATGLRDLINKDNKQ